MSSVNSLVLSHLQNSQSNVGEENIPRGSVLCDTYTGHHVSLLLFLLLKKCICWLRDTYPCPRPNSEILVPIVGGCILTSFLVWYHFTKSRLVVWVLRSPLILSFSFCGFGYLQSAVVYKHDPADFLSEGQWQPDARCQCLHHSPRFCSSADILSSQEGWVQCNEIFWERETTFTCLLQYIVIIVLFYYYCC